MSKVKKIAYVGAIPAALVVGVGIGTSSEPEPEVVTEEVEVIKEVEAEPEVITETEEVEVEVTPEACADAIASAESAFDIYSEALLISGDAVVYAYELDVQGLDEATAQIEDLTVDLESELAVFYSNAASCQ